MIPRPGANGKGDYSAIEMKLISVLERDFPEYRFKWGQKFAFQPPRTIKIGPRESNWRLLLLHEMGHAILRHKGFKTNIRRLKMEMEAWEKARELAVKYKVKFDDDVVQEELDTYRNWLHQKSRCPKCGLTRFETPDGQYHCPQCENF